jgi:hypothetical protein
MNAVNAINSAPLESERRSHEPSMEEILASIRRIIADDDALPAARRDKEKAALRPLVEAARRPADIREEHAAGPSVVARTERAPAVEAPAGHTSISHAPPSLAPAVVAVRAEAAPEPTAEPVAAPTPAAQPLDFWLRTSRRVEPEEEEPVAEVERWEEGAVDEAAVKSFDEAESDEQEPETDACDEAFADSVEDATAELAESQSEGDAGASEPEEPALVSPDAAVSVATHFQALAASLVLNEADIVERYSRELLRPMLKQWLDENLPHIVERMVRAEIERVARGRR